jgi:hypothetical protein
LKQPEQRMKIRLTQQKKEDWKRLRKNLTRRCVNLTNIGLV